MAEGNQAAGLLTGPFRCGSACDSSPPPLAAVPVNPTTPDMVKASMTPALPLSSFSPNSNSSTCNPGDFRCNRGAHHSGAHGGKASDSSNTGNSEAQVTLESQAVTMKALETALTEAVREESANSQLATSCPVNSGKNKQKLVL